MSDDPVDAETRAVSEYHQKHSTCDIQKHPWPGVFGAGFEAGRKWQRAQDALAAGGARDAGAGEGEA